MHKTFIILRHEFLKTIKRTGFIILTLALPVLALLAIGIFQIAAGVARPPAEVTQIGYVDELGGFNGYTTQGNINLVRYETRESATQALLNKDISEYFVVPQDLVSRGQIDLYSAQKRLGASTGTAAAIQNFVIGNLLSGKTPEDVISRVETPLNLVSVTLTPTGEVAPQQGGFANFLVPGIFSILLVLALVFTSTYVLQSLGEEKENRLMEILLSSVSTRQLLAGKVLGLGAAGLMQVIVWVITLPLLLALASSAIGGFISTVQVPVSFWVLGIIYFILGYLLFAVLSASVAAITSTVQEGQGLAGLYTVFAAAPLWFISVLIYFPDSPVWVVLTIFPFTAPVLVMLRLGATGVPAWQLAVSLTVLALCFLGGLLLAARLLRSYMLLYGKRPGLRQIIRSLRSS